MNNTQILLPANFSRHHAVVLLHGLGRTRHSFSRLARRLRADGYLVANVGYPSRSGSIDQHAARVKAVVAGIADRDVRAVSFVAFSLGCLIARRVAADGLPLPIGRIVMLGPPNRGSHLAARLARFGLYHRVFGASGREVLAHNASRLPMPEAPVMVIAGANGRHGYNPFLPGDNDGVVTVAETALDGRETSLLVPCVHTFLSLDRTVMTAVQRFLETGSADLSATSP